MVVVVVHRSGSAANSAAKLDNAVDGESLLPPGFRRRPLHPIYTQPCVTGRHRATSNGQSNTLTWADWTEQHRAYPPHDSLKVAARVRIPLGLLSKSRSEPLFGVDRWFFTPRCQWRANVFQGGSAMKGFIRQRGDAWELRVYLGADPVTGKQRHSGQSWRLTRPLVLPGRSATS